MPLKIVHCADLHIGAPFHDLPGEKAAIRRLDVYDSFTSLIEFASEKKADMLLICGDLFDSPHPSHEDLEFVKKALAKIIEIPVYIVCGNHDYMCVDSVFFSAANFPPNVHIFPCNEHSFFLPEKNAVIWGKSYSSPTIQPSFEGLNAAEGKYNIMCLHGDITSGSDYNISTSQILSQFGADYCAFGHIHSFEKFSAGKTPCSYCGTPEGHGFDDCNKTGFVYAEISENGVDVKNISFTRRNYVKLGFDITELSTNIEIIEGLRKLINNKDLYRIQLLGTVSADSPVSASHIESALSSEAFYVKVSNLTTLGEDISQLLNEKSVRGDFLRNLKELCSSQEEFELAAKIGLNALSGIKTEV